MSDRKSGFPALAPHAWLFLVVFAIALVGGVLIGRASEEPSQGTTSMTTVAQGHEATSGEPQGAEGEGHPVAMMTGGKTHALAPTPPSMGPIGAGLEGVEGLEASIFAEGLPNVESLTPAPEKGAYFASTGAEKGPNGVYVLEEGAKPREVISGLGPTIGILWADNQLYVSTMGEVLAYSDWNGKGFHSHRKVLTGLPVGEGGWNGDIKAGPEGRLYMAIGSPCDHCQPPSSLSASIVSFEPDGSDLRFFATRLRGNAFIEFAPKSGLMFAVSNERDDIEPTIPDEFLLVQQGDDFGFPLCKHHYGSEPACEGITRPLATLDPHGAQNGIAMVEGRWGIAESGLSAISTEWTLGKVIQTVITMEGDTVSAEPMQIIGGMRNPSSVIGSSQEPGAFLVADYGTGKIYTVKPGSGGGEATPAEAQPTGEGEPSESTGEEIVESTCSACHTLSEAGATGTVGPNLDELKPSKALVEKQVTDGGGGMPAFKGQLSTKEIEGVATYVSGAAGTDKG